MAANHRTVTAPAAGASNFTIVGAGTVLRMKNLGGTGAAYMSVGQPVSRVGTSLAPTTPATLAGDFPAVGAAVGDYVDVPIAVIGEIQVSLIASVDTIVALQLMSVYPGN